ncbi:MAG TPA: hypothetical protein VM695_13110 [Phycisphaerae bacterium]|nr:hypothetical protein [Phycisphaerae bacterium]
MKTRTACFLCAAAVGVAVGPFLALSAGPAAPPSGRVTGCEHFAFLRASMAGALGGPAREALKSWDGESGGAFAPNGDYFQTDVNNSLIFRLRDGRARVFAGSGTRGGRDGPADQAQFDLGVGSYSDATIACDAEGSLYVAEALAGRLRKVSRRADGTWWVSTIAGGGDRMPGKGEWIPAAQMKEGCASRFALSPDGTVTFASHGGLYRIRDGKATLLAGVEELRRQLGEKVSIRDWHVGGSHITPEGVFYWMPGGGPRLLRYDTRTGKAEIAAGLDRIVQGLDGPTLGESGFHTVLIAYRPDASAMYTCGGDESVPRRLRDGAVTTLRRDGSWRRCPEKPDWRKDDRWRQMAAVQCLDPQGRLYACTGDYGWGGWIVRFTFGEGD